jgi:hypothetical protein
VPVLASEFRITWPEADRAMVAYASGANVIADRMLASIVQCQVSSFATWLA